MHINDVSGPTSQHLGKLPKMAKQIVLLAICLDIMMKYCNYIGQESRYFKYNIRIRERI